jgi:hypothetical protein
MPRDVRFDGHRVTLGIYLFWVVPRLTKWTTESQDFA